MPPAVLPKGMNLTESLDPAAHLQEMQRKERCIEQHNECHQQNPGWRTLQVDYSPGFFKG